MGKKASTIKAKKISKTQDDKVKTVAVQETAPGEAVSAVPKPKPGVLSLARGGEKTQPETSKKVPVVTGKGREPVKPARKEPVKSRTQFVQDAVKFVQSAWSELKKVHWPSRQQLVIYTTVVIASVVVVAALIWVADSVLSKLLSFIL
jgi:preprotein translocase subunit SecE